MSRLLNVLFGLLLLVALVIALDPNARSKALAAVQNLEPTLEQLDDRVIVDIPSIDLSDSSTPVATPTSLPTPEADEDEVQIPVTGEEDSSDEPVIQVNWDALGDRLRNLWNRLKEVEIDLNPNDNR